MQAGDELVIKVRDKGNNSHHCVLCLCMSAALQHVHSPRLINPIFKNNSIIPNEIGTITIYTNIVLCLFDPSVCHIIHISEPFVSSILSLSD